MPANRSSQTIPATLDHKYTVSRVAPILINKVGPGYGVKHWHAKPASCRLLHVQVPHRRTEGCVWQMVLLATSRKHDSSLTHKLV